MNTFTQSLNMKALMESDDYVNNTDRIREIKHSELILGDIGKICELKKTHPKMKVVEEEKFKYLCQTSCPFLYSNYTDIFNKVVNDELDLKMMVEFVQTLKQIEDGAIDQYDASVKVGTILKEMYVDSAMRKGAKMDEKYGGGEPKKYVEPKAMSWSDFKKGNVVPLGPL
jgi:hypothetical protein